MISVSSKYMVQNTQCIIHGPVGKEVFWANSPKYIVQNEPSRFLHQVGPWHGGKVQISFWLKGCETPCLKFRNIYIMILLWQFFRKSQTSPSSSSRRGCPPWKPQVPVTANSISRWLAKWPPLPGSWGVELSFCQKYQKEPPEKIHNTCYLLSETNAAIQSSVSRSIP